MSPGQKVTTVPHPIWDAALMSANGISVVVPTIIQISSPNVHELVEGWILTEEQTPGRYRLVSQKVNDRTVALTFEPIGPRGVP